MISTVRMCAVVQAALTKEKRQKMLWRSEAKRLRVLIRKLRGRIKEKNLQLGKMHERERASARALREFKKAQIPLF